jgi:hypothetical protein
MQRGGLTYRRLRVTPASLTTVENVADGGSSSLSRVQWLLFIGVVVVTVVLSQMLESALDDMPTAFSIVVGSVAVGLAIWATLTLMERWNRR